MNGRRRKVRCLAAAALLTAFLGAGLRLAADCASYGLPFTDLAAESGFCAAIAEAYYTGLTNGTSATTYGPSATVTRDQMAAFITRTLDQSLLRGNRRAALDQWWTQMPQYDKSSLGLVSVGTQPDFVAFDGADLWVTNQQDNTVSRIKASDGSVLGTWTGATTAVAVIPAMGRIFVTGSNNPGDLYMIDPTASPGAVTTLASNLGNQPYGIAFDGSKLWTTNFNADFTGGGVSIITPGSTTPWSVTTVTAGFQVPKGVVFDGSNIWVTDQSAGTLLKLDSNGAVVQTVSVGSTPQHPAFDGHNIWVPVYGDNALAVVRVSDGTILKTFSAGNGDGNGLSSPIQAAFDGQRVMVTNAVSDGGVSLFRATDLSVIGHFDTPGVSTPFGVCSDGIDFWITFIGSKKVGRF